MKFAAFSLFFFLFLCSSFYSTFAQKHIVPGYLVTTNSDTIQGFINDKNWNKNPLNIEFKKTGEQDLQLYKPSQINSFYIAPDHFYESHQVSIDKSPMDLRSLSESNDRIIVKDTVFLLLCLKGSISLYSFNDENNKAHYYIQKDNLPLEELILSHLVKEFEGKKGLLVDKQYQRQLNTLLSDCPSVKNKISRVSYNRSSLQSLINEYNQCKQGAGSTFAASNQKAKVKIGLLAGGSMTQLSFKGDITNDIIYANFNKASGYTAGVGIEFFLKGNHQKWSIANELRWKTYKTGAFYKQVKSANQYTDNTFSLDLGYASSVNMVRYYIPFKRIRPYLNVGISNALALKIKNSKIVESHFYTTHRREELKAIEEFRKYEQGLVFGLGASWHKLSGELRYEITNGMSKYSNLNSTTKTLNVLVVFQLN